MGVTYSYETKVLTFDATAKSDGSFDPIQSNSFQKAYVTRVVVVPGTPNPTANYSITITDGLGIDVMGGALVNLGASEIRNTVPYFPYQDLYGMYQFAGKLTLNISGNSVNGAKVIVYIYLKEE